MSALSVQVSCTKSIFERYLHKEHFNLKLRATTDVTTDVSPHSPHKISHYCYFNGTLEQHLGMSKRPSRRSSTSLSSRALRKWRRWSPSITPSLHRSSTDKNKNPLLTQASISP